jgi:hypothetical protein
MHKLHIKLHLGVYFLVTGHFCHIDEFISLLPVISATSMTFFHVTNIRQHLIDTYFGGIPSWQRWGLSSVHRMVKGIERSVFKSKFYSWGYH